MIRKLLLYVLPFLLPFIFYFIYTWFARRRADALGRQPVAIEDTPWIWLIGIGMVLFIVALVIFSLVTGGDIAGIYIPPRFIDGAIVPADMLN